jgi:hypothetical protein
MYVQIGLLQRNHGTRCTMQTSQQIVVQKCADSQEIHLHRKRQKQGSADLAAVHSSMGVEGCCQLGRTVEISVSRFPIVVPILMNTVPD